MERARGRSPPCPGCHQRRGGSPDLSVGRRGRWPRCGAARLVHLATWARPGGEPARRAIAFPCVAGRLFGSDLRARKHSDPTRAVWSVLAKMLHTGHRCRPFLSSQQELVPRGVQAPARGAPLPGREPVLPSARLAAPLGGLRPEPVTCSGESSPRLRVLVWTVPAGTSWGSAGGTDTLIPGGLGAGVRGRSREEGAGERRRPGLSWTDAVPSLEWSLGWDRMALAS